MLLQRSIVLQASLILSACLVNGQGYEYEVSDGDDGDHHSSYTGGSDRPDYSSYFKTDVSAPLITSPVGGDTAAGFNPGEFSSFFSSPNFDFGSASNKQEAKAAIPLAQATKTIAGFVTPADFQSGFGNNNDPFGKDFFEQAALKQQQKLSEDESSDGAETRPGPNYVSHRLPARLAKEPLKTYATEVHDLNGEPEEYGNYKHESLEDDEDEKENLEEEGEEANEEEDVEEAPLPKKQHYKQPNTYEFDIKHLLPQNLENEGKLSYTAQTNPLLPNNPLLQNNPLLPIPEYLTKYTQAVKPTPYQKYSFQPAADQFGLKSGFLEALQSTVAPFNPSYAKVASNAAPKYETQPSEQISKNLKGKQCKKVNKDVSEKDIRTGRFKRQAMNCYVCEDPKNGANYEQCSYSSDPKTESYFEGKAEKYSSPISPESFRYKRYTDKQQQEEEEDEEKGEYVNPYDYVKSQSHKYYSTPDEFSQSYYNPKDFGPSEEYRFPQEVFEGDEEKEKSESEIVSEKLVKDGENCKKLKRKNMTCMVCTNPKTGGNYEQCSYTSAPAEKKYAYVRERKFDENENPIEDKVVESTEPKEDIVEGGRSPRRNYKRKSPQRERKSENYSAESSEETPKKESLRSAENYRSSSRRTKPQTRRRFYSSAESQPEETKKRDVEHSSYEIPDHFVESTTRREKAGVRGLDPELYGSSDSSEVHSKKEKKPFEKQDYHYKYFPKFNEESESKNEEKRVKPKHHYDYEEGTKRDVEAVLAEFAKKDRSNCKKAEKNGMTCYSCVDKNGIKNEECMFVSESQPQSSHIAYHEVKKIKSPEEDKKSSNNDKSEKDEAESKQTSVTKVPNDELLKKKRFFKKVTTQSPIDVAAEPSRESSSRVRTTTTSLPPTTFKTRVPRKLRRTKNLPKDTAVEESKRKEVKAKSSDPTIKTPKEFDVADEDGAYTLETRPVYSKVLGLHLPKYMVEVSEHEKFFDDATRRSTD